MIVVVVDGILMMVATFCYDVDIWCNCDIFGSRVLEIRSRLTYVNEILTNA